MQVECDTIPLMMQANFKARGWLGLLLGARLWYPFWDADQDDDDAFEKRLDAVCKEIGDRGKPKLPEAVPPPAQAPARVPASVPAPAPAVSRTPVSAPPAAAAPALAAAAAAAAPSVDQALATPQRTFSPSVQMPHTCTSTSLLAHQSPHFGGGLSGTGLEDLTSLMREERSHMKEERELVEAKMERVEAKLEQQRQGAEQQSQENARLREQALATAAVDSKVAALQLRVEALHVTQLLADEELYSLEDIIADGCEGANEGEGADDRVANMIALSERMASDGAFSRQLRRKFV